MVAPTAEAMTRIIPSAIENRRTCLGFIGGHPVRFNTNARPRENREERARCDWDRDDPDSGDVELTDGDVDFLAGLGDPIAQALMLGLELGRVHAQDATEEGVLAVVVLLDELMERILDLV